MVTIKKKRGFFTLTENWFGYQFNWTDFFMPACYKGLRQKKNSSFFWGVKRQSKTVVLSLTEPLDVLFANFSTSHKRYIKKAQSEGVQCYSKNDRSLFVQFYNEFAKRKGLYTLKTNRLEEFCGSEWNYFFASLNGQLLAAHSYIEDKETGIVRLMESASMRLDDQYDASKIAQANKLLHHYEIKYFKERGLLRYDFGGWENIPGLLEFKKGFGAQPIIVFDYYNYPFVIKSKLEGILSALKKNIR